MERVLVVLRGSIGVQAVRRCCAIDVEGPRQVAICHVVAEGHDGIDESLRAQRDITSALRAVLGDGAEEIAVLVAAEGEVDECARQWGATRIFT